MTLGDERLDSIVEKSWYRGQIVHLERQPRREARHRAPELPLHPKVAEMLERRGLELYEHQAEALDRCRHGEDVLVATPTASGKSLAYNLVVADALLEDAGATALYLFPTKALSQDQLGTLVDLDAEIGLSASPAVYDGDTPGSARARIRARSRVILSNPYGLHEYLPQVRSFEGFLSRLAVVVLDEAHRYRGVFGSHVAFVLRRLLRISERLGARPRVVLASATVANPGEHAAALTGRKVSVVDDDGAASSGRLVAVWDSMADPDRSAAVQAANLVAALSEAGHRTICFTGSRAGAELVAEWAAARAPGRRISPYRAGFTPAERREIEAGLRSGSLDAVVTTNALELGIDIGGLDAAVLTGYPGTVAATWQQIGRAGRGSQAGLGVLVAGDDPLDQYLVRRPEVLFGAPVERAVISLGNPEVLAGEVLCAAAELPLRADDGDRFGPGLETVVETLRAEGLVAHGPAGDAFAGGFRPASAVRIDGRADDVVEVRAGGRLVEVLDRPRAYREAHEGAILVHRGQRYRVHRLDLDRGTAEADPVDTVEHTEPIATKDYLLGDPETGRDHGAWRLELGPARIRQQVVGFKLRRGSEVLHAGNLDLPAVELHTRAVWMTPYEEVARLTGVGRDPRGSLHAAEHALIHAMPLLAMCDRGDAGGLSTLAHAATGGPLVLLYDGFEGGAGIADVAFDLLGELAALACDMVGSCDCELGCPRCVYDRACGNENRPMDRLGALGVLRSLR